MKFKILPKVHAMRINRTRYMPGSIVDLPASYRGTNFLQEVPEAEQLKKVESAAVVKEPVPVVKEVDMVPAATKVARRNVKKSRAEVSR